MHMKTTFFFIFFLIFTSAFSQSIYTIPNATKQPKFVFPIYLEEGGGQRDTLYIGYDPNASSYSFQLSDTIYGVKKIPLDTSKFYAVWDWCSPPFCLDGYKANVTSLITFYNEFPERSTFSCNKGVLPLKISWDTELFYSDSLPFPSHSPGPRGQGRFYFGCSHCLIRENFQQVGDVEGEVLICDNFCFARDSVVIYHSRGDADSLNGTYFFLYIQEWTNGWRNIKESLSEEVEIKIYGRKVTINNVPKKMEIQITTLLGQILYQNSIPKNSSFSFDIPYNNIYFVRIFNHSFSRTYKISAYENH